MRPAPLLALLVAALLGMDSRLLTASSPAQPPRQRTFRFFYAGAIDQVPPGKRVRVWIPLAQSAPQQSVEIIEINVPGEYRITREAAHGNALLYFEATPNAAGRIPFRIVYRCTRFERTRLRTESSSPCHRALYLRPARLVPIEPQVLAGWAPLDRQAAPEDLYDAVDQHMRYAKPPGQPWGRGDVRWACGSGIGNCSDFHSLFLAACRFHGIPSRFEIGFPIPEDRHAGKVPGYHCWASFESKGRWIPVDISEADKHPERRDYYFGHLDPHRIRFSVGRDLLLEPPNQSGPVNFLIYPHVEIDGRNHTPLVKDFAFEEEG